MVLFQNTHHIESHWKFRGGGGLKDQTFLVFQTGGAKVKKTILCRGSKDNTYIAWGRYKTQFPTVLCHCSSETYVQHSQSRIQGRGPGSSLPPYFKTKLKGWIIFLETPPPHLSKALGDPPLPSPHLISTSGSGTGSNPITWYMYSFLPSLQKVNFIRTVHLRNSPFPHSRQLL